jgi:YbbR domain-containing protein
MKQKRIHIILATTLFAALLWVSVNLGNTFQTLVVVPLTLTGLPRGMAMQAPVPRSLLLKLNGEGWRLAAFSLGTEIQCAIDLTTLQPGQSTITMPDVVERLGLPGGVQPVDMNPDSIIVAFDSLAERRVPVALDYVAMFRDRYGQVGPAVATPDSVTLSGAASVLAAIDSWKIAPAVFENLKAPLEVTVPLAESDRYQISVSPREVRLRIDVQWFAEKVLSGITVDVLSVPPHREVILVPPRLDLVVRGGVELLSRVRPIDVRASLDYVIILSDTTGALAPEVVAPPGVQIVSCSPERLQYIVRKRL